LLFFSFAVRYLKTQRKVDKMAKADFGSMIATLQEAIKTMETALASVEGVCQQLEILGERDICELPWEEDALLRMIEQYRQAPCEEGYEFLDRTAALAVLVRAYQEFFEKRA
jgi:hypothetical protein